MHAVLKEFGFERLQVDHCVYTRTRNGQTRVITVYVDDLLIFTDRIDKMEEIKASLKKEFEISDLGEPKLLIGLQINRDRENRTIAISQENYIERMLRKYQLQNVNPVATPLDPNVVLAKCENDGEEMTKKLIGGYATAIGSLMYTAIGARPDIAFAVQTLSQFTSNPGPAHWTAIKRVFRYLAGTRDLAIVYGGFREDANIEFTGYLDADFAANPDDRKSISGNTYLLGGAAISWSCKKQTTIALSSTEAEYTAIAHAMRQAIWLRYLFEGLGYAQTEPTIIFGDNQSAIALTQDAQFHARSKHFDIQNHFVREKIEAGIIEIFYCPTNEMLADVFTKGLPKPKHQKFMKELGMLPA